ncbi:MAG TPA: holo-ACP synthase [Anaerolineaceae bacterium]
MILRTGIDIVEVARLEKIAGAIRQRFILRVFTPEEIQVCQDDPVRLAGRFAAKEAVAKALGCGISPVGWQSIEILQGKAGEPVLILHGAAQSYAISLGLETWSVSISHTRSYAAAVVVALGSNPDRIIQQEQGE